MTTRSRLLLVIPEFRDDPGRFGGLSSVARFALSAFQADGKYDIEVVAPRMSRRASQSTKLVRPWTLFRSISATRSVQGSGIPVTEVGAYLTEFEPFRYLPRKAITDLADKCDVALVICGSPAIAKVLSASDIPVVIQAATTIRAERAPQISRMGRLRKIPTLVTTALVEKAEVSALRRATKVLVENRAMLEHGRSLIGEKTVLVAPGIDTEVFHPSEGSLEGDSYILSVGRLNDPRKRLSVLLHAYSRLKTKVPNCPRLVIASPEPIDGRSMALAEKLGLAGDIEYRVALTREELAALYRQSCLFWLASSEEGLGMVFLEAMASGVPVVTTDTEGARYAIGEVGCGTLVPVEGQVSEALATAAADILNSNDKGQALGRVGRSRAVENFSQIVQGRRFVEEVDRAMPVMTETK